jgi:hypothetical protein
MNNTVETLLRLWGGGGGLAVTWVGLLGLLCLVVRRVLIAHHQAERWLEDHRSLWTRLVLSRHSGKLPWVLAGLVLLGLAARAGTQSASYVGWAIENPGWILSMHGGLGLVGLLVLAFWDDHPSHVKLGEGRTDSQFRDLGEDWGRFDTHDGKPVGDGQPVAALLGYRDASRPARRALLPQQRRWRNLALISLRWDLLSRHVFIIGPQGSGKTTTIYGHIMHSAHGPWIYQDSKAELPLRDRLRNRLVWGLDVRGHQSRSGVWNPMEEIRSADDFDLLVDYVFPVNLRDANKWVRDMARILFSAILRSRRWESIQEISRTLRATRLEPFLANLDPVWRDLLKEPKSQVPVLQDLVATLARWETPRVSSITEGPSTVTLDEFIAKGGWVMNCEMADALRAPIHLFWAMLLGRLRNRPEGSSPILLLLDEFGDAGQLPNFERALVLLRSKGVAFVAGIQNLGLLKDVYPQNWQAVAQGFGSKIWLLRNADDEIREGLTRALGKWTRKVKAANAKSRDTEKDVDLMPLDAWGRWSDERAALARSNGFTYWLPLSLPIPPTPMGPVVEQEDPWKDAEARAERARQAASAPGIAPVEELPPLPKIPAIPGLELIHGLQINAVSPQPVVGPVPVAPIEDWL